MVFLTGQGRGLPAPADVPPPPSRGQALAVVLESRDIVGGGLQAQDEAEFVVDLIEDLPKRCLTQVPAMRVANWLPISWASWAVILWPRKVATCSALTVRMACRESCS